MKTLISKLFYPTIAYTRWLHTRWPAGKVEKLPLVKEDGTTNIPGVYIVGDLTGIPLLKFAVNSGARAVQSIIAEPGFKKSENGELDLAIIGGGVSGISAAIEARKQGLDFRIFEAAQPFSTIANFPKGKPIYTYPTEFKPAGGLQLSAKAKEDLLEEVESQRKEARIELTMARVEQIERKKGHLELVYGEGKEKVSAKRVIVATGRSGNFRKLGVPGENLEKVYNRLHDPKDFCGKEALVVGGGDFALETAIALASCGAKVTLSYRKKEFSRPKLENLKKLETFQKDPSLEVMIEEPSSERVTTSAGSYNRPKDVPVGSIRLALETKVEAIRSNEVVLSGKKGEETISNEVVFSMIGREAPLDFFRRSKIFIKGEWTVKTWLSFLLFFSFCWFLYLWKANSSLNQFFQNSQLFPYNISEWIASLGEAISTAALDPSTLVGTLAIDLQQPGFYFSLAYCLCVVVFGILRIRKRKTPYITVQTCVLAAIQVIPLFLLPYIVLPLMGHNEFFGGRYTIQPLSLSQQMIWKKEVEKESADLLKDFSPIAKNTLPSEVKKWGSLVATKEKEGVLSFVSTDANQPGRSAKLRLDKGYFFIQDQGRPTSWVIDELFPASEWDPQGREYWRSIGFILAWPLLIWNVFTAKPLAIWLVISFVQTFIFIPLIIWRWGKGAYCGWICSCGALAETLGDAHRHKMPHGPVWNRVNMLGQLILKVAFILLIARIFSWIVPNTWVSHFYEGLLGNWSLFGIQLNYYHLVDIFLAGIVGVGFYFWFSGRVWCRFACPLAALMHIYTRFSRFRIFAEKSKCISCNLCTSVCHQGIDVMNFANKGMPMEDPECVRCSACVQSCPTGVLSFGCYDVKGKIVHDSLPASPVQIAEKTAK